MGIGKFFFLNYHVLTINVRIADDPTPSLASVRWGGLFYLLSVAPSPIPAPSLSNASRGWCSFLFLSVHGPFHQRPTPSLTHVSQGWCLCSSMTPPSTPTPSLTNPSRGWCFFLFLLVHGPFHQRPPPSLTHVSQGWCLCCSTTPFSTP